MKKDKNSQFKSSVSDDDSLRPEYDFSQAERGMTAKRYAQGTNVVVLDPDVVPLFPTAISVNQALRELAEIKRKSS